MTIHSFVTNYKRVGIVSVALVVAFFLVHAVSSRAMNTSPKAVQATPTVPVAPVAPIYPPLDKVSYDVKMNELANGDTTGKWPVTTAPYPLDGAILPFKRVVAFYGNLYSKKMGILGEYSSDVVISKLAAEVKKWEEADPTTPVQPALHYVAVVAQATAGADKTYISRMPFAQIDKVIAMAETAHAIVFLDVQTGNSTVSKEIPKLEKYLKMPNVHLGIDPEFSMKNGKKPGTAIGSLDAVDVNTVSEYLAKIVQENHLPPKILVVHRFTGPMVTHYQSIKTRPEVQLVMDMDGWGTVDHKKSTYKQIIQPQPVQFTGFKLFYKNDVIRSKNRLMTPSEVLELTPKPSYIQYQ